MSEVPDFAAFDDVDAHSAAMAKLAAAHPGIATLRRVGTSRLGEPIEMLTVGSGQQNVFMFASAHPDEPIGAMTITHLAELLCTDPALRQGDLSWHLIPCVNPDEMRLNEAWFQPPFSLGNFARNCYRPPMHSDLEWSFPFIYKSNFFDRTLRETEMLMRIIDELQPAYLGSLHNNVFGGVYYYLTEASSSLIDILPKLAAAEGLPLRVGEPETPYVPELAPAVLLFPSSAERYEYEVATGSDPEKLNVPNSSLGYATARHGTRGIIIEAAYFDDPRVADTSEIEQTRREVYAQSGAISHAGIEFVEELMAAVAADLRSNSVFEQTLRANVPLEREIIESTAAWAESSPDTLRKATVADLFANRQEVKVRRLINLGTMIRLLETEIGAGHGTPTIRRSLERALTQFGDWEAEMEAELQVRVVPIRHLVAVQLGAILSMVFDADRSNDVRGEAGD